MSLNYGLPITVSAQMPYQPSEGEILYVEGRHTIQIERWRIEYYKEMLCESVNNPVEYTEGYFSLIVKLLNEPSVWDDFKQKQRRRIETEIIANYRFTDYVEIAPSLLVYDSKDELGQYKFQQFEIVITETVDTPDDTTSEDASADASADASKDTSKETSKAPTNTSKDDKKDDEAKVDYKIGIITGTVSQGEEEFQELCEFLRDLRLERVGAFAFSPEEGTPRSRLMLGLFGEPRQESLP